VSIGQLVPNQPILVTDEPVLSAPILWRLDTAVSPVNVGKQHTPDMSGSLESVPSNACYRFVTEISAIA